MKKAFLTALSVLLWIYFVISSVVLTPLILLLWILTVIPDRKLRLVHLFSCFWGAQYIWAVPVWKLRILGRDKINTRKPCIWVSNHQSLADILVIYSIFRHFRWTSKVENFRLPFVGWVLSLNRSIKIYRGASDAWEKFEAQAVKELSDGNSIMIFPEGTRSRTGEIGKFKEGAFRLALQTKTDIQPMVLDGTSRAIPKSGWILTGREEMVLKVLDPIPFEEFKEMKASNLSDQVHAILSKELKAIRSSLK